MPAGPVLLPVAHAQALPCLLQRLERRRLLQIRASMDGVDDFRFGLSFHANGINLEESELVRDRGGRPRSDNDG
jgi:hypothetical protein